MECDRHIREICGKEGNASCMGGSRLQAQIWYPNPDLAGGAFYAYAPLTWLVDTPGLLLASQGPNLAGGHPCIARPPPPAR